MDVSNLLLTNQIPLGSPAVVINISGGGTIFGGVVIRLPSEVPILVSFIGELVMPPPNPCDTTYHYEIVAIKTVDGTPSLEGLSTVNRNVICTLIDIVIVVSGSLELESWRLNSGTADPDDPGQLSPADYDPDNPKFWEKVG